MALKVLYEAGVSATYEDITDRVNIGTLDVTQHAEEGSVPVSTIIIDDPLGDYEIKGYRRIAIYETEGADGVSELIYNGFIVDRDIIRGRYRTGAKRKWSVEVADTNCLLEFRLMTGVDADRPAETTAARLTWLLGESEMGRIPNHDYVNLTDGIVAMDAVDYRGQRAVDVLNDIAQASGMNYFAFCIDDTPAPLPAAPGATHLWYDWADSTEYSSTLSLSNDLADVLADPERCFEISLDSKLRISPQRVYSGGYGRWDGGETYIEDTAISNEFTRRDAVIPMENVKSSAKATARVNRQLADMSTEEHRITTSVVLPASKVGLIQRGMRIPFKATHFPEEYREFTWQRILNQTTKQVTEEFYLLTLTLGTGPSWPPPAAEEAAEAGPATLYAGGDNGVTFWINGTLVGDNGGTNSPAYPRPIADGIVVAGDNVLAMRIDNGTSPVSWELGNYTWIESRLYPAVGGTPYTFSSVSAKVWLVENFFSGTLGGTPANWNEASFDDSGWDAATDVTEVSPLDVLLEPIAPARLIAPAAALTGNTVSGLVWLVRMNFTV